MTPAKSTTIAKLEQRYLRLFVTAINMSKRHPRKREIVDRLMHVRKALHFAKLDAERNSVTA